MAGDHFTKARAGSYFDDLLMDTNGGIQKLFRKYAVHPADSPVGYTVATQDIRDPTHKGDFGEGAVPDDKIVSWAHLEKLARANQLRAPEGADTIYLDASITPVANWNPVYFLPWKPQCMVHMTIPRKGTRPNIGGIAQPDPDIFFTSAINGCSVFFQGTPDNPKIYHCGGDPDYPSAIKRPDDAATFWRNLVQQHGDATRGAIRGEVNKTQYITDVDTSDAALKTTAHSRSYAEWLKSDVAKTIRIKEVKPWGSVFGFRVGNNWEFYLQENATITYATITKQKTKSWRLKKSSVEINLTTVGRPMHVRKIWPGAGAVVNFSPLRPWSMLT